jgi:hypothetical protein
VELVPGADNKFTLKLYTGSVAAKVESKPAPKAPVAKLVTASAPANAKPALVASAENKPAVFEAKATTTSSPTDFVFVEPSYAP